MHLKVESSIVHNKIIKSKNCLDNYFVYLNILNLYSDKITYLTDK